MDCPFDSPKCLCQYCSLEKCQAGCTKENQRCGFCVENGKQMWSKILCRNFTPLSECEDMFKKNLSELQED